MTAVLPAGHTFRRPTKDDAEAIYELVAACNTAAIGFADYTLDDMADELAEPGFDLDQDAWMIHAGEKLAGYGAAYGKGDNRIVDVDVYSDDRAVSAWLLDETIARGQALARANGLTEVSIDANTYRSETAKRELLADNGFTQTTTYQRMRIDHTGPVAAPDVPEGVVLRHGAPDEETRRVAHAVFTESFTGQYGFVPSSFDEWHAAHESQSTFDWSQVTLLELDGRAVGFLESNSQFVEDENCNYVPRLGVLEEARGRGLAKLLLRDAFAADAAAGRAGTILHVDTNNPTPALGLYLSVGMKSVLIIDVWRRTLPVTS